MGIICCPRHGNGFMGFLFVCPHVVTAVLASSVCRGIQSLAYAVDDPELTDDFELTCWFCPQCIEENQLPQDGAVFSNLDGFLNRTSGLYRPMCPECFKEWQAQGLGAT